MLRALFWRTELKNKAIMSAIWGTLFMSFPSIAEVGSLLPVSGCAWPFAPNCPLSLLSIKNDSSIGKPIKISGTLNGGLRWMQNHHITDVHSQSASDLYIRKFEIGLASNFSSTASATAVLNSEWIGDYENSGDGKIAIDEVHLDLQSPNHPLYLVFGQRTQPFGIFENHLMTEPMTQDAYETKKVGMTAGYNGPLNSDFSITIYKGREHINHFLASQLIDTTRLTIAMEEHDDLSSLIFSASFSPEENNLTLFGSMISEPGKGTNNTSVGLGISLSPPF
jgi:hypothetical protein